MELFSEGQNLKLQSDNIVVAVRVRPLSQDEILQGEANTIRVVEDGRSMSVIEPGLGGHNMIRNFQFNACLGPGARQQDVFQQCGVKRLLDSALQGYNCTILAYGQTGSGKSYTMSGKEEVIERNSYDGHDEDGLISRSMSYLFDCLDSFRTSGQKGFLMKASYLEIYNEQVNDLLREGSDQRVEVKWSDREGFYAEGLLIVDCETREDVCSVMSEGARNRKVGSHALNKDSSRSHSMMTVYLESKSDGPNKRFGKVTFVDLAGSERLKISKSSGEMVKETGSINRSLFTLGKVISALGEGRSKKDTFVPYRDSKLTKLLMDSLGGSSMALMIACCSPALTSVEETLSTLNYATRAKNIVNTPTANADTQDKTISALKREIALLKEENLYLRQKLGLPGGDLIKYPSLNHSRENTAAPHENGDATPSTSGRYDDEGVRFPPIARRTPSGSWSSSGYLKAYSSKELVGVNREELVRRLQEAQSMVTSFQEEKEGLLTQVRELQEGQREMELNHRTLLSDNQSLAAKLEDLEAVFSNLDDEMPLGRRSKKSAQASRNGARDSRRLPPSLSPVKSAPSAISSESNRGDPSRKWIASTRTSKHEKSEGGNRDAPGQKQPGAGEDKSKEKLANGALSPTTSEALGSPTRIPSRFRDALPGEYPRDAVLGAVSRADPNFSEGASRTSSTTRSVPLRTGAFVSPKKEAAEIFQLRQMNARLMRFNEQLLAKSREYDKMVAQGLVSPEGAPVSVFTPGELMRRRSNVGRGALSDGAPAYSRASSFASHLTPRSIT